MALPNAIALWAAAALIGGWMGAEGGGCRFCRVTCQRALVAVLTLAVLKLNLFSFI
jgi:hypothetical protein